MATTAVRPQARGRAMGLITTLGPLGLISGALGPALATLVWSISSYEPAGMRAAMALATVLSALSVVALVRTRAPGGQVAVP